MISSLSVLICCIQISEVHDAYNQVSCITKNYRSPTRFVIQAFDCSLVLSA